MCLFLVSILTVSLNLKNKVFKILFSIIKLINICTLSIIFFSVFTKFNIYLWNFKEYTESLIAYKTFTLNLNMVLNIPTISFSGSILSDVVVLLALSSGLVCLYLLGEKNITKYCSNLSFFCFFFVAIMLMVYTVNLLVMFISFELLFLPTLYFVYSHGYVERADKTLKILLYWTLAGAFLVLVSLSYLYFKYKTLNYNILSKVNFTYVESVFLFIAIFVGFGIKIPVAPFHYWLTKIHVEAPAGFSIFLSGFLVKAALYCFYTFNLILSKPTLTILILIIAFYGITESSIKMWNQTDFKKLIAYATIQEMNLILFLLIGSQNVLDYGLILFILIHGWLSTLMFFLVDIIQKKTNTRNIVELSGLGYEFPGIKLLIWFIILLFSGFPLTIKFVIEWEVLGTLLIYSPNLQTFIFFVIAFIGVMGFAKQMIIILYGFPRREIVVNTTISKKDKYLFYFIVFLLIYLNLLNFFLA
jgi:NADH:ubiquinone oxidoreductase subunit 4 (subunit M)